MRQNRLMYQYEVKIPKERIAVLIGEKGKTKREIEHATKSKLDVDSAEGDVFISGEDSVGLMTVKDIVKAIGRGFNPEVALRLTKQDYAFDYIDLSDFARNQKDLVRVRGRMIGREGKARQKIESLTNTNLCVYGKTVAIIGTLENVSKAKSAIESLLKGSPHNKVYGKVMRQKKDESRREMLGVDKIHE